MKKIQEELPWIGLRLMGSALGMFMVIRVLIMGDPVHWGKGGPVMPRWPAVLSTSLFFTFWLKGIWAGVTRSDLREFYFDIRHPGHLQTLGLLDKK